MKPVSLLICYVYQVFFYWNYISYTAAKAYPALSQAANNTDTQELNIILSVTAPIVVALIGVISACIGCIGKKKFCKQQPRYVLLDTIGNQSSINNETELIIDAYARYLKNLRHPLPDCDGLPSTVYVEPAIVISEADKSHDPADDETLLTHLKLNDILKPKNDGKPVKCVLIEGAPGIGKSTLVWQMRQKWEELKNMRQYKIVVLVRLKEVRRAKQLEDILPHYESMNELLTAIGAGSGMLLILDGFDELPREQRKNGSLFIDLITGIKLPEATIMITSRPSSTAELSTYQIDRRLKILGFSGENVEQYARSKSENFLKYVNSNAIVKGMMYLPLNAFIVASVFEDTDIPQIKTMTQLFDALSRSLVRRHLVREGQVPEEFVMPPSFQCRENVDKLPASVSNQFYKLAHIAYEGLTSEKYTFTLTYAFDHLGLMQKKLKRKVDVGPTYEFSYLHLTLQEYLAALHILLAVQEVHVPSSFGKKEVLRFLAGLCCVQNSDSLCLKVGKMLQLIMEDNLMQVVRCVYECDTIIQRIPILHEMLFNRRTISVSGKMPFDYYIVGHCICRIGGQWNITVYSEEEAYFFIKGFEDGRLDGTWQAGTIQVLKLLSAPFKVLQPILSKYCYNLHCLQLYFVAFESEDARTAEKFLMSCTTLKKIELDSCKMIDHELLKVLFGSGCKSLETLHFKGKLDLESKIQDLLCGNTNLKKLLVEDTIIGPLSLAEVLKFNHELEELTLVISTVDDDPHHCDLSSSFPPRPPSVVTHIDPRLRKTPIQALQDAADNRQPPLLLDIEYPANSNTPANSRRRSASGTITRSSSLTSLLTIN